MLRRLYKRALRVVAFFLPQAMADLIAPPPMAEVRRDAIYSCERDLYAGKMEQERVNSQVALLAKRLKRLRAEDRAARRIEVSDAVITISGAGLSDNDLAARLHKYPNLTGAGAGGLQP